MAAIPNVPHRNRDALPHTWTKVRRVVQLACLALFAVFPLTHWWSGRTLGEENIVRETYVQGHFAASSFRLRDFQLHLADPFAAIEVFVASHEVTSTLAIAATIVLAFYWLVGGRTFCGWACPLGTVLDFAEPLHRWLRKRWRFQTTELEPRLKYQILAVTLLVSALTGLTVFELVSPIFALSRAIAYGVTSGLVLVGVIVAFEILVARRGWCESLCPVGAFYGLVGKVSPVRIAINHDICDECKVCARYCVTPRILDPPIDGETDAVISADCTLCGACLDDCPTGALSMQIAFRGKRA